MIPSLPKILVIGYNAFDVTVPLVSLPETDSKTEVPFVRLAGGGPGATAALALARLGADVHLITPLTDDPGGLVQRSELESAGVDLTGSPVLKGQECAKAVILVQPQSGERTILWSRGELPHLAERLWDERWLDGVDLLYVDGHEPALSLVGASRAALRGIPVVYDAGSVREGSAELAARCTDVISSSVFAPALAQVDDPLAALELLRERGPRRVALTLGPEGVLALGERPFAVPAFQVPVTDTTGAGDVFHAGYALSRARGDNDFFTDLEFGAAAAALKCSHWGARGGLPTLSDVLRLLEQGVRRPLSPRLLRLLSS